jgi:hypothetical protein
MNMKKEQQQYTIWIEAEQCVPGSWNPEDANTDVIVTWEDGSRWVATFFSYQNVQTLSEKNRRTGESLSGAYFWASDMILADQVSRERIEQIIEELIKTGEFETTFTPLPSSIKFYHHALTICGKTSLGNSTPRNQPSSTIPTPRGMSQKT